MARVEIGITHQFPIDGEPTWVRLAVQEDIDTDGFSKHEWDQAIDDLSDRVNTQLIRVVEQTIDIVSNYEPTKGK